MERITRKVRGRTLTCKDFTSYKLMSTAEIAAQKVCEERNLEEVIVYTCGTCGNIHILDENIRPKGN